MLADYRLERNTDGQKTVVGEAFRISSLVGQMVGYGQLDEDREVEVIRRLTEIACRSKSAIEAFMAFERVEASLHCKTCKGTGYSVTTNGVDVGPYFVATASDGYDIGIWRNDALGTGVAWSWNQIDDCVDLVEDATWEDEQ